MYSRIYNLRNM